VASPGVVAVVVAVGGVRVSSPMFAVVRTGTSSGIQNGREPLRTRSRRPGSVGVRGSSPLSSTDMARPFSLREGGLSRPWSHRGGQPTARRRWASSAGPSARAMPRRATRWHRRCPYRLPPAGPTIGRSPHRPGSRDDTVTGSEGGRRAGRRGHRSPMSQGSPPCRNPFRKARSSSNPDASTFGNTRSESP
jgi:hypothetical protein